MNLRELLQRLSLELPVAHEVEQIIEWVLFRTTGRDWKRSEWVTDFEIEIDPELANVAITKARERNSQHTPLQYLTETQWFYGRKFSIQSGVLIPRPETEILVEAVVDQIQLLGNISTVGFELGVGAGPIAISLLAENLNLKMFGTDINPIALLVTEQNARNLLGDSTRLSLFSPEHMPNQKYNFVVSNPPYLNRSRVEVDEQVLHFEPEEALFAPESDLLYFYKYLEQFSRSHLKPNGFLALEVPHERAKQIHSLFDLKIWKNLRMIQDLNSRPRVLVLELI